MTLHLFEFMDQGWLPGSLRGTLREILQCACSMPFRSYYDWVSSEVLRIARERQCRTVVELGAGTAPVTQRMAALSDTDGLQFIVCDMNPDQEAYRSLASEYPSVHPCIAPIDFTYYHAWEPNTLLFLSATLHHIPVSLRPSVLAALTSSGKSVAVFEPLRRNVVSVLFVFLSIVPALLVPMLLIHKRGRVRRAIWCWLVPIAPLLFCWDGVVSCIRQWTESDWQRAMRNSLPDDREFHIKSSLFCQMAWW